MENGRYQIKNDRQVEGNIIKERATDVYKTRFFKISFN
jgi:hypothetical protein